VLAHPDTHLHMPWKAKRDGYVARFDLGFGSELDFCLARQ